MCTRSCTSRLDAVVKKWCLVRKGASLESGLPVTL